MKGFLGRCLFGYGVAFFIGYVIISVGLGAVIPSLYKVAEPILCGEEQSLEVDQQHHSWRPGANMWTARINKVGKGVRGKEDCTTVAKLVAGAIYGLIIFILLLPRLLRKTPPPAAQPATDGQPSSSTDPAPTGSVDEKLAKLKQLHEDGLINAEDYEQKKADVLKGI